MSGLHHDIAVQISEVPIARLAYSESAKLTKLKQCLETWLSAEYPSQVVDVVVHSGSLRKSFNPEKLAQEFFSIVRAVDINSGDDRYRYRQFSLSNGEIIDVRRFVSLYPCSQVHCGLSDGDGFRGSFKYAIENKCCQFNLYQKSHLLCVVLWSKDFMNLNEEIVIDAFRACETSIDHIDSIWFVHQTSLPLVYPIFSQSLDSRNNAAYLQCYQWWPALGKSRTFKDIPHQFGCKPAASLSDA